jgi:hypothetical protein
MPEQRERRGRHRATYGEIVGAWLHLWTPRRDTYIPPVPVVRLLLVVLALAALTVGAADLISTSKEQTRARERRQAAAANARLRAQFAREQLPRHARFAGAGTAGAAAAELPVRRRRVLQGLEAAITADSQRRFRAHVLDTPVTRTSCVPFVRPTRLHPPQPPLRATTGKYECLGVTDAVVATGRTPAGEFGFPFWARVDFRRGSAVWCKVNPRPGERGIGGDVFVPLARQCDLLGG